MTHIQRCNKMCPQLNDQRDPSNCDLHPLVSYKFILKSVFETGSHYVTVAGLELAMETRLACICLPLPLPPVCWN